MEMTAGLVLPDLVPKLRLGRIGPGEEVPGITRDMATVIANVERPPMNFWRTISLLETREGPILAAGGGSDLSPAQIKLVRDLGLVPAPPLPDTHAEVTNLFGASELGLTPTRGVATNPICDGHGGCQPFIEALGGKVTSDVTFEF